RVELLKLAVILALWAAVVAAFVSVIYRRQSDVDQARVRDLKLVYDLQLDREISARREYELTVESQLRRELASELRAQASDEVAALRTELAALRTNLEILFETELHQRPALETERATVRGYSQWSGTGDGAPADWVSSNRVTSVRAETTTGRAEESSIIDVPEEPVPHRGNEAYQPSEESQRTDVYPAAAEAYPGNEAPRGSHWRPADDERQVQERQDGQRHARPQPEAPPAAERRGEYQDAPPHRQREPQYQPQPDTPPEPQRPPWYPFAPGSPQPGGAESERQPTGHDERWATAGASTNNWTASDEDDSPNTDPGVNGLAPVREPSPEPPEPVPPPEPPAPPAQRRGRHSGPDAAESEADRPDSAAQQRVSARHSAERPASEAGDETGAAAYGNDVQAPAQPQSAPEPPSPPPAPTPEPVARHRSTDEALDDGPPTGGQSVADLLARFQVEPAGGGRRRRRED
ncbi:MAG TPA: DUF6779 domain-containing protein, partial [Mycobacterium sp.]|nr:DUF6779 domain-containing protein [Mycobacterium sp.]